LEQVCIITKKKYVEICRLSLFDVTESSWEHIRAFFRSYLSKDNTQYGYNWARIINDGYMRDYSPKEMIYLAGIFAGIIEKVQGPGIWQAEWAKGQIGQLEQMKRLGHAIFEETKPDLTKIKPSMSSAPILQRAQQMLAAEENEGGLEAAIGALP